MNDDGHGQRPGSGSSSSRTQWVRKVHGAASWVDSSPEKTSSSDGPHQGPQPTAEMEELATEHKDHDKGTCEPCVFFTSSFGCRMSDRCKYCHLPHPKKNLPGNRRPQRRERTQTKERILEMFQSFQDELQREVNGNHFVRKEVMRFLNGDWDASGNADRVDEP
ncbi:Uncharacterized protein SCF082_LOCUS9570 [Durusdinium trenchii]|uniref:C3H1-type domain-containing protein n=1 Tax=Durusdinium trenchii TaxID=1381693 RepID=A0ABP0J0B0_9DINO